MGSTRSFCAVCSAAGPAVSGASKALGGRQIKWTSSSVPSTDRLRLRAVPAAVSAGGQALPRRGRGGVGGVGGEVGAADGWWSYDAATGLAVVMHAAAADVVVTAGSAGSSH